TPPRRGEAHHGFRPRRLQPASPERPRRRPRFRRRRGAPARGDRAPSGAVRDARACRGARRPARDGFVARIRGGDPGERTMDAGGGRVMKVLLADDHAVVRKGIHAVLTSLPGIEVVAETADGREALALIERLRPDVAVLDITMPGLNGLEVATRSAQASPRTKILILSMHAGEAYVAQALRAGVSGYLLKDAADDELPLAIKAIGRGD